MDIVLVSSNGYGAGKTAFANYLKERLIEQGTYATVKSFASGVKKIAELFGWDGKKDSRGRRLLQLIGTEIGRWYNENIWIEKLLEDVEKESNIGIPPSVVIVDDWRFKNEYQYLVDRSFNVISVRILQNNEPRDTHISERDLDDFNNYDYIIHNTFSSFEKDFGAVASSIINQLDLY